MDPTLVGVWPTLPPHAHVMPRVGGPPFPLGDPACALFARARHGLWQGVQALGLRPSDAVLVPAYHHGSEIEALLRAGIEPRFYGGGPDLEPDATELDRLLTPEVRALYITHFLGFPQLADRWRAWCDERGVLLLEDAAQAWLATVDGRPVGSFGDLAIFCLYKTFGVPDGSALVVRAPVPAPEAQPELTFAGLARRHGAWAVERSSMLSALARRTGNGHRQPYIARDDFALGDPSQPPALGTRRVLDRIATPDAAARRRAHYLMLLDQLGEHVPEPFDHLAPGASPFAFPIETGDKAGLLERLTARGVRALDFWSVPHSALPPSRFPAVDRRRERTVCLPVHQELTPEHLDRVAVAARKPRARRLAGLSVESVTFDAVRDEWAEVATRTTNVFGTWEWAEAWWRHFGGGRPLHLIACRSGRRLAALLPLYEFSRRPFRVLRFIGHGPADQLGPVCHVGDRPATARALRSVLADLRPNLLIAEHLPGDEGWEGMLGGRTVSTEHNPVLRFRGLSWDETLAARSANLRQQVRRQERKLIREHGMRLRLCTDPGELESAMDTLFALHRARWRDGASAFTGAHAAFHRDFAATALERGWLRLWFLEADGRTVAAWQGFRFGGAESYYQAGRDPGWRGPSVGLVLLAHTIRSALEDGMREYRFLRGGEAFKFRFADCDPGLASVAVARDPLARAGLVLGPTLPREAQHPLRGWLSR